MKTSAVSIIGDRYYVLTIDRKLVEIGGPNRVEFLSDPVQSFIDEMNFDTMRILATDIPSCNMEDIMIIDESIGVTVGFSKDTRKWHRWDKNNELVWSEDMERIQKEKEYWDQYELSKAAEDKDAS